MWSNYGRGIYLLVLGLWKHKDGVCGCELIRALFNCVQSSTSTIILPQCNVHGFAFPYRAKHSEVRTKTSIITTHNSTFQKFPGISDQLSEVSKFQHHTKLCPTCSFSIISSLNVSTIWWWKELLVECCSCHGNLGFNLACASCIVRYQATQIVKYSTFYSCFWSSIFCTADGH